MRVSEPVEVGKEGRGGIYRVGMSWSSDSLEPREGEDEGATHGIGRAMRFRNSRARNRNRSPLRIFRPNYRESGDKNTSPSLFSGSLVTRIEVDYK